MKNSKAIRPAILPLLPKNEENNVNQLSSKENKEDEKECLKRIKADYEKHKKNIGTKS